MLSIAIGADDSEFASALSRTAAALSGFGKTVHTSLAGLQDVAPTIGSMQSAIARAGEATTPLAAAMHRVEAAGQGLAATARTVSTVMFLMPKVFAGLPPAVGRTISSLSLAGHGLDVFRGKLGVTGAAMTFAELRSLGLQKQWAALAATAMFAGSKIVAAARAFVPGANATAGLSQSIGSLSSRAASADSAFGGIAAGSNLATASVGKLVSSMLQLVGVASVTAGIGLAIKKSFAEAADAEDLRTTFRVLIGDATKADAVMKEATTFADVTPFDPKPVQEGYKSLIAYGFALKDIKGLMTDAGDLASVMKVELGEVTRVFGRLKSGDFGEAFERLRDFGISKSDLEAQGLKFDKGGSFQGTAEQAMEAVRTIIKNKFGGTMDAVSQTWNGKWSTLVGYVTSIFREFGTPLMDALKPALDGLIEYAKQGAEMGKQIGAAVANAISISAAAFRSGEFGKLVALSLQVGFAEAMNYLVGGLTTYMGVLGEEFKTLFSPDVWKGLLAGLESLGARLSQTLLTAFSAPIRYLQAGLQLAVEKAMEGLSKIPGLSDMMGLKGFKASSFDDIYNATEPSLAGRSATDYGKQAEDAARRAQEALAGPAADMGKRIQEVLKDFEPAEMFQSGDAKGALESLIKSLQEEVKKSTPPDPAVKPRATAETKATGDTWDKNDAKSIPVSSLAKIGGGGYSTQGVTLQREANNLLKQVVKNTAEAIRTKTATSSSTSTGGAVYA